MKKLKWIIVLVLVLISVGMLFQIKTHAAVYKSDTYVRVNVDSDSTMIIFQIPYIGSNSDFVFIENQEGQPVLSLTYENSYNFNGQLWRTFYANGDQAKPMTTNQLYLLRFDNGINHYIFYTLDFGVSGSNTITKDDFTITEMFTVSGATATQTFFDIISSGFIMRYDINSSTATDSDFFKNTLALLFNSDVFFLYAINKYDSGYSLGYQRGYNVGYDAGQEGENAISPVWNVLTGIFSAVGSIFAIELAPRIYLGYFILVPLFFTMILGILAIWRKNW